MISEKQLAANRKNAKRSTGPRSAEGKAICSRNGTKHGIFARDLLLAGEDENRFHEFRPEMLLTIRPRSLEQLALATRIIESYWRLHRVHAAERSAFEAEACDFAALDRVSAYGQRLMYIIRRSMRELQNAAPLEPNPRNTQISKKTRFAPHRSAPQGFASPRKREI